jgi:dimeric dUTPase (all-alpha-NTP-PPase superfamily)
MDFEKDLKEQFVNKMKNINELKEKGATKEDIELALSYNLGISECLSITKKTDDFLKQTELVQKHLGL